MPRYSYEPLTARDMSLLGSERPGLPLQAGLLQIFDAHPLLNEFGGIQFEKLRCAVATALHHVPRYRQSLASIPMNENLVWVDDANFQLDYHLRQVSLPRPGTELQLKRLMGRIMAQPLDRTRPLWELWVVEGMCQNRFAIIFKAHLCMGDSVAGVDLMEQLFAFAADEPIPKPPVYHPRPLPSGTELLRNEWRQRSAHVLQRLGGIGSALRGAYLGEGIARGTQALREITTWQIASKDETPLNGPVGPHRLFDTVTTSLIEMKEVRKALGCSINDLILAILTGAIRDYMRAHQVRPADIDFRVEVPLALRRDLGRDDRETSMTLLLPLDEEDPCLRIEKIRRAPRTSGALRPSESAQHLRGLFDWLSLNVQPPSVNMVVSNTAGQQEPLYLLGAEMLEAYPTVPLMENLGLCVGVFSYDGKVHWGLDADYDRVPDLDSFARGIRRAFDELAEAARKRSAPTAKAKGKRKKAVAKRKKSAGTSSATRARRPRAKKPG